MGMALVAKSVMSYCQEEKGNAVSHLFHSKRCLTSCTLQMKWRTSVLSGRAMQLAMLIKED